MQYVVIRPFSDSTDNDRFYDIGDTFPADGLKVAKARINALLTGNNKNGQIYIAKTAEESEE